jgi:hypothetical protein
MGKLIPNVAMSVATDGAGLGASGGRMALRSADDVAEQATQTLGKHADPPTPSALERPHVESPPPPMPRPDGDDFGSLSDDFGDFGPSGGTHADDIPQHSAPDGSPSITDRLNPPEVDNTPSPLDNDFGYMDDVEPSPIDHHPDTPDQPVDTPEPPQEHSPGHVADHAPAPEYSGDPDFRATDADRAAYRETYQGYEDHATKVKEFVGKHPEFAHIPEEDLVAVRGYTSNDYYSEMNQGLREGDQLLLDRYESYAKSATSGLNQLPSHEGQVFRGIHIDDPKALDKLAQQYQPGEIYRERAFFSTDTVKAFPGNVQYEVYSTSGHHVKGLSAVGGESEVLFAPGTAFKVVDKRYVPGDTPESGKWYITLRDAS